MQSTGISSFSVTHPGKPLILQFCLLLVVLAICGFIYTPGLNGPLLLDDYPQLSPLMDASADDWGRLVGNHLFSTSGQFGRPVSMASFIFNAAVHGADTWYWKATNVFIHLVNGLLVFFLARALVQASAEKISSSRAGWWALLLTGLWLLHPLHISTVLYTVQRMAQLSALFVFAGLLSYAIGRKQQIGTSGKGWGYIAAAFLIFFPLSVLSKENGLLFPLYVLLVEILVFRLAGTAAVRLILVRLLVLTVLVPAVLGLVYLVVRFDGLVSGGYLLREFTLMERVLTQPRILFFYLHEIFVPLPGNMGLYHDDVAISRGLFEPVTALVALVALVGLLFVAWWSHRKWPLISLGVLVFLAAHLLESTIFPLEMMFEHRNYLALFGVALAFIGVLIAIPARPRMLAVTGSALAVFLVFLTGVRASIWGSYESLVSHMHETHPESRRITTIVANAYADAGHYPQALSLLSRFDDAGFRINRLYIACLENNRIEDTALERETGLLGGVIGSHAMTGLIRIANLGLDEKCSFSGDLYLDLLDKALSLPLRSTRAMKLHMYRAHFLHRDNDLDAAIMSLEESYKLQPDTPLPLFLATEWLLDAGQVERAREQFQRAMKMANGSIKDYSSLSDPIKQRFSGLTE
jgi:tetratricopeptide (TPR) repeat protein